MCVLEADTGVEVRHAEFAISEGNGFDVGELLNTIWGVGAVVSEVIEVLASGGHALGDGVIG